MVLNSSGPVHSRDQTERWLLFNRDMMGPAESDVGSVSVQFISIRVDAHFKTTEEKTKLGKFPEGIGR